MKSFLLVNNAYLAINNVCSINDANIMKIKMSQNQILRIGECVYTMRTIDNSMITKIELVNR